MKSLFPGHPSEKPRQNQVQCGQKLRDSLVGMIPGTGAIIREPGSGGNRGLFHDPLVVGEVGEEPPAAGVDAVGVEREPVDLPLFQPCLDTKSELYFIKQKSRSQMVSYSAIMRWIWFLYGRNS